MGGGDEDQDPFLGTVLDDRYEIESRLGHGGMGVVYAARHVVIDKPVAIKILRREYCRDPGLVERFMREARAASRIGHPNIVDVTDFGRISDGHIFFVMEFLHGETLAREIRKQDVLPLRRVIDLGIQMCHGLQAAHSKGIVHRDLKPENVFIVNPSNEEVIDEADGQRRDFVKLLDFGIAKINWGPGTRLTKAGSIFGTPQYMSPEQAAGHDADHRGDIYSCGCILYEMVTGEVPFLADTFMGTLTKHMFESAVPPRELRPDLGIPQELEDLIACAMNKEPDHRFQVMTEMSDRLAACYRVLGQAPRDGATFPPGATQVMLDRVPTNDDTGGLLPEETAVDPGLYESKAPSRRDYSTGGDATGVRVRSGALPLVAVFVGLMVAGGALGLFLFRRLAKNETAEQPQQAVVLPDTGKRLGTDAGTVVAVRVDKRVTLSFVSVPVAAQIEVNGEVKGRSPLKLTAVPGDQLSLLVRKKRYRTYSKTIVVGAEKEQTVSVDLRRVRPRRAGPVRQRSNGTDSDPNTPRIEDLRRPPPFKK